MLPRLDSNQQPFDSADQLDRQRGAAAILRHGWPDHPDRAEQIIAGPAFRYLADRMLTAQQDGHDVTAMLRRLDPVTLTAAHIPSPSGAVTFAFSRAHTTPGPADLNVSDTEPATLGLPEPDPADPMPGRPAPVEAPAQQPAMHWSQRPHGQLTDLALRDHLQRAQRDLDRLAHDRAAAEHRPRKLRTPKVDNARGECNTAEIDRAG